MFLVATKAAQGPLRVNDMRIGATLNEAMAAGDRVNDAAKYKSTLRIWKVSTDAKPILVAELRHNTSEWEITARGRKILYGG